MTITSGVDREAMARALAGEPGGHALPSRSAGRVSSFKLWLKYAKPTQGRLVVDEGAERALRERGTSLLPVGVVEVEGEFEAGDAVEVRCDGRAVGKGIVDYSAGELRRIKGLKTDAGARAAAAGDRGGRAPRLLRARLDAPVRSARRTTARSSSSPCRRSARWRPSRSTCSPTPRWSATSAREELAALAIAGTLLTGAFTLFNFLTYGTTAQVARLHGAGEEEAAGRHRGAGAVALRRASASCLTALLAGFAVAARRPAWAATAGRASSRSLYLRIGSLGLPSR